MLSANQRAVQLMYPASLADLMLRIHVCLYLGSAIYTSWNFTVRLSLHTSNLDGLLVMIYRF